MLRLIVILFLTTPALLFAANPPLADSQLLLMKNDSPLIAFRILLKSGSAAEPKGKEGIAQLTSSVMSDGSTQKMEYQQILQALFPMAASYISQVDKEMTIFGGVVHKDNLTPYYALLRDAILSPAFKQEDFERVKTDQINSISRSLRYNNDEELGKETLNWAIFKNHPYGRPNAGTVTSVTSITLQDVKDYYAKTYTRANIVIGIAGNFSDDLVAQIKKDFGALPAGQPSGVTLPPSPKVEGLHAFLVEKQTQGTAISFGFPIPFTRADADYYPMMVMSTWLGQHRNSFSHLYQVMRESRGLNYGDYSYIEHFPFGGQTFQPRPNYARHEQIFQVWIRPVQNQNRHFALRQAFREVQMLIDNGMSQKDFELSRNFLLNYTVNLAQSNSDQLGYALDGQFYGLKQPFLETVKARVAALKLEDVNAAIKKYLTTQNVMIGIVTQDAAAFQKALAENAPSPIQYDSPKPQQLLDEDKIISVYPLPLKAENIQVIPVDQMFQ